MNKVVVSISNHPLIKLFLLILAVVLFPVNSLLFTPQPQKAAVSNKPKSITNDKKEQENDTLEDDDHSISSLKSIEGSPINNQALFPTINHINNTEPLTSSSIKPCSTGVSTHFLPYKNEQGEIEWAFTEDSQPYPVNMNDGVHQISPTVSNSSNSNSYTHSDKIFDNEDHGFDPRKQTENYTPNSLSTPSPPNSTGKGSGINSLSEDKGHQCPHCEATFKLRGYLTRHLKKHSVKKAYCCPFHKFLIYIDENNGTHKCHPTGGFSRRDTYKTHLKSRHFKYPKGTKTKERSKTAGSCSMCGESFPNSEIWCEIHIEGGECKFLPSGFKGKSRIKNRLKKQLKKKGIDVDADAKGNFNLSSFINNNLESLGNLDLDIGLDNEGDADSNNDSNDNESFNDELKPIIPGQQQLDKGVASSSPNVMSDFSQSPDSDHEMIQHKFQVANLSPESNTNTNPNSYQESYINQISSSPEVPQQYPANFNHPQQFNFVQTQSSMTIPDGNVNDPLASQSKSVAGNFGEYYNMNETYNMYKFLDYDDEFCLDVDQLNQFNNNKSMESSQGNHIHSNQQLSGRQMDQQLAAFYQQTQSQLQSLSNASASTNQSSFSSESSQGSEYHQYPSQVVPQPQQQHQQHPQFHPQQQSSQAQYVSQQVPNHGQMTGNMAMTTGMNFDDVPFDQYNLQPQPQYVQY